MAMFFETRFLVSGSDDEMLHIHDLAALPGVQRGGGGERGGSGVPCLRCLHDARGSGIVRVACLQQTPLAFAEVNKTCFTRFLLILVCHARSAAEEAR